MVESYTWSVTYKFKNHPSQLSWMKHMHAIGFVWIGNGVYPQKILWTGILTWISVVPYSRTTLTHIGSWMKWISRIIDATRTDVNQIHSDYTDATPCFQWWSVVVSICRYVPYTQITINGKAIYKPSFSVMIYIRCASPKKHWSIGSGKSEMSLEFVNQNNFSRTR